MLQKTEGVILSKLKYSESSFITKVYTRDFGLQSYIISGVRAKRAKHKANLLQPLSLVELVAYQKENRDLHRIKELRSINPFVSIPYDPIKVSVALFIAEVIQHSLKEQAQDQELFLFLSNAIALFDLEEVNPDFHLLFLLRFSRFLGFYPQVEGQEQSRKYFDLRGGVFRAFPPQHQDYLESDQSDLFYRLLGTNFEGKSRLEIGRKDRKMLLETLLMYYQIHLVQFKEVRSVEVLEALFD